MTADAAKPGGSRGIAMLIPEFPGQTHAFFWREIAAMEAAGAPVQIVSTRKPAPEACPHTFREAAVARTTYVFPPDIGRAALFLARRPGAALAALRYVQGLRETPAARRARLVGLIPSAVELVRLCQAQGIDHVHIHSCANAAHLGALAQILGGIDYSLTLHGNLPVYGTDHGSKMARARFVSAVTRPLADEIRSVRADLPAPVIMMGVDTDRFAPAPAPEGARARPFEVVSIARLNPTKGHRFFLRAMAALRDAGGAPVHYTIAGDGPAREAIVAEIAALGLGDQVDLIGSVSEDRVLSLLQGADALALTSIGQGEAAPVAVMEAMACGLPVISSVIGGTPDMVDDGRDGLLVPQEDVEAITAALRQLADDPQYASRIGTAARATALKLFDYRANAARLLAEIRTAQDAG
ncbi:exopolysaccharide biosynthesis GT4 family glycosyltransferase EpsE [Tropicimonas sp. S265A]|uniref:exopolysaccharide biosynthesis GT4 family glycosyltransferase EpsE n=1 Tax=Tropicimonas sp. S265A TaxID=3415134 RepID=UPI003C7C1ABD